MAKITQDIGSIQDPNYTNRSQGITPPKADKSMETLFSGLGDAVTGVTKAVDSGIQENIKQDVYKTVDALVGGEKGGAESVQAAQAGNPLFKPEGASDKYGNLFGGSTAGTGGNEGGGSTAPALPAAAQVSTDRIAKLQQAYKEGRLNDSYYHGQLQAMVQDLRAKYPGYRDQVDQIVSGVTGVTPANALRKSVLAEMEAKNASGTGDKAKDMFLSLLKEGQLLPQEIQKGMQDPTAIRDIIAGAGIRKANDTSISRDMTLMSQAEQQNRLSKEVVEQNAISHLGTTMSQFKSTILSTGNMNGDSLASKLFSGMATAAQGGTIKPEDMAMMRGGLGQLRLQASSLIDNRLDQEWAPGSGITYRAKIGADKAEAIKKSQLAWIDNLEQGLANPTSGLLAANIQAVKATTEAGFKEVFDSDKDVQTFKMVNDQFSPEVAKVILGTDGRLGNVLNAIKNRASAKIATGNVGSITEGLTEALQTAKRVNAGSKAEKAQLSNQVLDSTLNILTNPGVSKDKVQAIAGAVFSEKNSRFLDLFADSSRPQVFNRMTGPEVTSTMQSIGGTTWQNYKSWAGQNAGSVFKQIFTDAQIANRDDPNVLIQFNDKTKQFELIPSPQAQAFAGKVAQANPQRTEFASSFFNAVKSPQQGTVDAVNGVLRNVIPIIEADGHNSTAEVATFIKNLGVNPNVSKDQRGILGKFYDGIVGSATEMLGIKPAKSATDEGSPAGRGSSLLEDMTRGTLQRGRQASQPVEPTGDSSNWREALRPSLNNDESHLEGMNDTLGSRMAQMLSEAPPEVREGLKINSGYRTEERQAELYAQAVAKHGEAGARRWVAPPGRSQHNHGMAADLGFSSAKVREWVHENAPRYGLHFPMGHENWHIEPINSRSR